MRGFGLAKPFLLVDVAVKVFFSKEFDMILKENIKTLKHQGFLN